MEGAAKVNNFKYTVVYYFPFKMEAERVKYHYISKSKGMKLHFFPKLQTSGRFPGFLLLIKAA
jgi:hypothetical protein